jgi:hypothetical protein
MFKTPLVGAEMFEEEIGRRTDRDKQDEAKSGLSQFYESAYK